VKKAPLLAGLFSHIFELHPL